MIYRVAAYVDDQWFEILGQITRHQPGFVWEEVEETDIEWNDGMDDE